MTTLDPEKRTFTTTKGLVLTLQRLNAYILERLYNSEDGKPAVPIVETVVGGEHTIKESNPLDPAYTEAVATWQRDKNMRIMRYTLTEGVTNDAPPDFVAALRTYFPHADGREMRYLWLVDVLDEEEKVLLSQAIVGQTTITAEAVEKTENRFRRNGKRSADPAVPVRETGGEN